MASIWNRALVAVLMLGVLATGRAGAADQTPSTSTRLLPYLQYADGNAAPADVLAGRARFTRSPNAVVKNGPATFWIRFTLHDAGLPAQRWLLLLPNVEHAAFYAPPAYREEIGGTNASFDERTVPLSVPAFVIPRATVRDAPIYARIEYHTDQAFAPTLRTAQDVQSRLRLGRLVQGTFIGAMIAVVFFNLYAFFGLRERPAIFFAIYAAAMIANEVVATGIGTEYLWPSARENVRLDMLITSSLAFSSFLIFARAFLLTRLTVPLLDRLVVANLTVQLGIAVVQYAFPLGRSLVVPLLAVEFFGVAVMTCAGIVRWRQGFRPALLFLIAFIPSTCGVLANIAYDAFLPRGNWFWANYGVEFGVMLQAIVISFSVIDRIHVLDRERRRAVHIAATDALTGIANRLAFYDALQNAIATGGAFGILYVDLDGFKPVNDRYGHSVGDELLRIIAQRLEGSVRSGDLVARLGGDEFAVLLRGAPAPGLLRRIADGARASITEPMIIDGAFVRVGASIGTAVFPADGTTADGLVDAADRLMYEEKGLHKELAAALAHVPGQ